MALAASVTAGNAWSTSPNDEVLTSKTFMPIVPKVFSVSTPTPALPLQGGGSVDYSYFFNY